MKRKLKKNPAKPHFSLGKTLLISLLAVLVIGVIAFKMANKNKSEVRKPKTKTSTTELTLRQTQSSQFPPWIKEKEKMFATSVADNWWLRPGIDSEKVLKEKIEHYKKLLGDPRIKHLGGENALKMLEKSPIGYMTSEIGPAGRMVKVIQQGRGCMISFVTEDTYRSIKQGGFDVAMFYLANGKRYLNLPGLDMPDAFMVSVLMHEMGHATRHLDPKAPEPTHDAIMQEEGEQHLLGHLVADAFVEGAYESALDKVISRIGTKNGVEAIEKATAEDYETLSNVFCPKPRGKILTGALHTQHLFSLSLRAEYRTSFPPKEVLATHYIRALRYSSMKTPDPLKK